MYPVLSLEVGIPGQEIGPRPVQVLPRDMPLGGLVDLMWRRLDRETPQAQAALFQGAAAFEQIVGWQLRPTLRPAGDPALERGTI